MYIQTWIYVQPPRHTHKKRHPCSDLLFLQGSFEKHMGVVRTHPGHWQDVILACWPGYYSMY